MVTTFSNDFYTGCDNLIRNCAVVASNDKVLVISDNKTSFIGNELKKIALTITDKVKHYVVPELKIHGQSPPVNVKKEMISSDIILSITSKSIAHSKVVFEAIQNGARFLSLPDYSIRVMESKALQVDFQQLTRISSKLAKILTNGTKIHITSSSGTNLFCNIENRTANAAPGWCYKKGMIASPPDSETNIALVENKTNGILIVDGSIPCDEIGLLSSPITLTFKEGKIINFKGKKADILQNLFEKDKNPNYKIAAEFGIGLNPQASIQGLMLEDEGTLGTIHIGIGANIIIGGKNSVPFHLDHIIKTPTVNIDGNTIMTNGTLLIN